MKLLGAAVAGSIAGMVGAGIWAAIAYFAHAEVGWIAWGVGFLVGIAVRIAVGRSEDAGAGVLAMVVAVVAVLGGKYVAVSVGVDRKMQEVMGKLQVTEEAMTVLSTTEVVEEWEAQKKSLKWPAGKSLEDAEVEADFPPDAWKEGKRRWEALPADERERRTNDVKRMQATDAAELAGQLKGIMFKQSFGVFDLLWFALAAGTAFRVACGGDTAGSRR